MKYKKIEVASRHDMGTNENQLINFIWPSRFLITSFYLDPGFQSLKAFLEKEKM